MKATDFSNPRRLLDHAVADGVVPGAVIAVGDQAAPVWVEAFGQRRLEPDGAPASVDTIYDVASVTKAVATSVLAMAAVGRGALRLDDRVGGRVDDFVGEGKADITVRQLLAHASGLPAHRPLWRQGQAGVDSRRAVVAAAAREPLIYPPGTRSLYSDLGFIVLGELLERTAGRRLDHQFAEVVTGPLGLQATGFVEAPWGGRAAATPAVVLPAWLRNREIAATQRCPERQRILVGEVDDLNAAAMEGVAGHAGLFSTVGDLNRLVVALLAAWRGEGGPIERDVIRECWRPAGVAGSTWRLGWDGPAPSGSLAGERLPRTAVGHLGF
ncbi:MAG: serine hydrolase domain-containing protein, partial [Pseudomonadota bacterium]